MSIPPEETLRKIDFPQSSVGAPLPHVIADEQNLTIAYIAEVPNQDWDGINIRGVTPESEGELCTVVNVQQHIAVQFGPPNDEAIAGHRLYPKGLLPYASFEVLNSSWIKAMETANRIHRHHKPERYARLRHIILTFHDSTIEFVAEGWSTHTERGSVRGALLNAASFR
jgi:hypothetical protein